MATIIQERLTPAQVSDACRLYVRRMHAAKPNMPPIDEVMMLAASDIHMMKGNEAVPADIYDYVMVSYNV